MRSSGTGHLQPGSAVPNTFAFGSATCLWWVRNNPHSVEDALKVADEVGFVDLGEE
jgi:hypothetical protein